MLSIAKTYRHRFKEICNSFLTYGPYNKKTSNAFIEGKNRLCKKIKAFSCGFNNFAIYRARILYISSDVTYHLKRATINEAYIKKTKRKRVANATIKFSIAFLETIQFYKEPSL